MAKVLGLFPRDAKPATRRDVARHLLSCYRSELADQLAFLQNYIASLEPAGSEACAEQASGRKELCNVGHELVALVSQLMMEIDIVVQAHHGSSASHGDPSAKQVDPTVEAHRSDTPTPD